MRAIRNCNVKYQTMAKTLKDLRVVKRKDVCMSNPRSQRISRRGDTIYTLMEAEEKAQPFRKKKKKLEIISHVWENQE